MSKQTPSDVDVIKSQNLDKIQSDQGQCQHIEGI